MSKGKTVRMKKKTRKQQRTSKRKARTALRPQENQFPDYHKRLCDKCGSHVWTNQNTHYCGGNLL